MSDEDRYIVYAYYYGEKKWQRFYARSNTNFDENEPGLMKYIENVPLEIAERICRNGKQELEELLTISTLLSLFNGD
ncbi:MAG: hypothetical protein WC584_01465 [Candidatus Pacearchaeota archaeon]